MSLTVSRIGAFRALRSPNYRLWISGAVVSDTGAWIQRIAQDWLVLTQLTHHNAAAVGVVMAMQYLPLFLLLPIAGLVADRMDRRKLLMLTQGSLGLLALGLGVLTLLGVVQLWHVWVFAALSGVASAFDAPARHTFAGELVGEDDLANAVSLNSTSFNLARLIGPALSGLLIAAVGSGPAFLINAASFGAVLCSLFLLRLDKLHANVKASRGRGGVIAGFRYVWARPDLRAVVVMMFLFGALGLNLPIYISTMTVSVFHAGAGGYGLLTSIMAIGSLAGVILTARSVNPGMMLLMLCAAVFFLGFALAAVAPGYWFFALAPDSRRRLGGSVHHRDQQLHATRVGARHARARHRHPHRRGHPRRAGGRAVRRMGCRHVWPALGMRPGRGVRPGRRGGGARLSHPPPAAARPFRRRTAAVQHGCNFGSADMSKRAAARRRGKRAVIVVRDTPGVQMWLEAVAFGFVAIGDPAATAKLADGAVAVATAWKAMISKGELSP